jgi:hypothetical protein
MFFWSADEKFCVLATDNEQSLSVRLVSVSNSKQHRFGTKTKISTSFFFFWSAKRNKTKNRLGGKKNKS